MAPLVAGLALLVLLVFIGRGYIRATPKNLAKRFRFAGGVALGLATLALLVAGRLAFAMLTAGGAWFLLLGSVPPWMSIPGIGTGQGRGPGTSGPPRTTSMSRAEALKVLGLEAGASEADIRAAHRRLIQQTHPDKGGTSYLAAKINEAKDILLKG
ncbi:MAG: hypothetical protein EXR00_00540 [Alphaproteobacteria bacterium]|nr:hypothetical protein [Alphaproteobacteria bacterium]